MPKSVFICYRRDDTAAAAGRVYDRLGRLISKSNVFFDVSTVAGGEDFEKRIDAAMQRIDSVLVFIGHHWLDAGRDGRPRIWDEKDYVRAEIRSALASATRVIPVLVDGASMPKQDILPEDLRALATRNAVPLRHESFDDDTETILALILGAPAKERIWERKSKLGPRIGFALAGCCAGLVGIVLLALLHRTLLQRPLEASIGEVATILAPLVSAIAGAWLGLAYEARRRRRPAQAD